MTKQTYSDLFGGETPIKQPAKGFARAFRKANYRKAPILFNQDIPCCGDCQHLRSKFYRGKTYYKCALVGITNSEATDIRLSYVCDNYNADEGY